jgi:hypothetical protein
VHKSKGELPDLDETNSGRSPSRDEKGERFHRCEIEVTINSSPNGGIDGDLTISERTQATVKPMLSRPSGMTLVCTGLRRQVGSELVEPGALSGLLGGVRVED